MAHHAVMGLPDRPVKEMEKRARNDDVPLVGVTSKEASALQRVQINRKIICAERSAGGSWPKRHLHMHAEKQNR